MKKIGISDRSKKKKILIIGILIVFVFAMIIVLLQTGVLSNIMGNSTNDLTGARDGVYTIEYNSNNGSGYMPKQQLRIGSNQKIHGNTFSGPYDDSKFIGWIAYNKTTNKYLHVLNNTDSKGNITNVNHYMWEEKYIYRHDDHKMVQEAALITDEQDLSEIKGNSNFTFANSNDEIILYAIWDGVRTITFNANGGYQYMSPLKISTSSLSISVPNNEFIRDGYRFAGWKIYDNDKKAWLCSDSKLCSDNATTYVPNVGSLALSTSIGENLVFYAQWLYNEIPLMVKYDADGGIGDMPSQNLGNNTTGDGYYSNKEINKIKFEKNGYSFAGWKVEVIDKSTGKSSFQKCDSVKNETITCNSHNEVVIKDGGTLSQVRYGNSVVLHAIWEKNSKQVSSSEYTLKFNPGGGTGTMPDQKLVYGISTSIKGNIFTRN